jgi:demethoxyubiquinone hydroxylase (CLK1/Coq7/Cat5 family)
MQREETGHRRAAEALGARDLPEPARHGMRLAARLMTTLSYWI